MQKAQNKNLDANREITSEPVNLSGSQVEFQVVPFSTHPGLLPAGKWSQWYMEAQEGQRKLT